MPLHIFVFYAPLWFHSFSILAFLSPAFCPSILRMVFAPQVPSIVFHLSLVFESQFVATSPRPKSLPTRFANQHAASLLWFCWRPDWCPCRTWYESMRKPRTPSWIGCRIWETLRNLEKPWEIISEYIRYDLFLEPCAPTLRNLPTASAAGSMGLAWFQRRCERDAASNLIR